MILSKQQKNISLIFSIACLVAVAGCKNDVYSLNEDRYSTRSDTITQSAGDSVNSNKVTHAVSPLPKHVQNDEIQIDSDRSLVAVDRYQSDNVKDPVESARKTTRAPN